MGIFSNVLRKAGYRMPTRPPVEPYEIGRNVPGNDYPDQTADRLEQLNAEGTRRLLAQHGRQTLKQPR